MKKAIFTEAIAYISIILFLYTAISKLTDHSVFREQIAMVPVLQSFAATIAWLLPLIEIIIAVLMFLPKWRLIGFYSAFGLMVAFTIYVAGLMTFNEKLPCSCGGIIELLTWKQHLILNILLVLLQVFGIKLQRQMIRQDTIYSQPI